MLRILLTAVLVIFLTLLSLNQSDYPYIWIYILWVTVCAGIAVFSRHTLTRAICVNLIAVICTLLVLEVRAIIKPAEKQGRDLSYSSGYRQKHPILGYAPVPDQVNYSELSVNGEPVYKATYTINELGLRADSQTAGIGSECVIFFGGSFVYGEGLNDDSTVPARVSDKTGLTTVNFGFHGYGPHQMLAALEFGLAQEKASCKPVAAFYFTIADHIRRSAGKAHWDKSGPRYRIDNNGQVIYTGPFDAEQTFWTRAREKIAGKLKLSRFWNEMTTNRFTTDSNDEELFVAITRSAKEVFNEAYPGVPFYIVVWNTPVSAFTTATQNSLQRITANLVVVDEVIPDLYSNQSDYFFPNDGHPTAKANQALAAYLTQLIATQSDSVDQPADNFLLAE